MSYYNKGSMGQTALVTADKGGGNFTFTPGVDDPTTAIEDAMSYLNTFGGGTLVTKGPGETWVIEEGIESQGDYITWVSDLSLILQGDASLSAPVIRNYHDWVTYDGLNIDGNKAAREDAGSNANFLDIAERTGHIRILNCKMIDGVRHNVYMRYCDYVEIGDNYFEGGSWNNVTFRNNTQQNIHHNYCYLTSDVHISDYESYYTQIHNNVIWDTSLDTGDRDSKWGIGLESSGLPHYNVSVHDNIIFNVDRRAIDIGSQSGDYNNVSVRGNQIYDCGTIAGEDGVAIRLRRCTGLDVVDNMFYNCCWEASIRGHIYVEAGTMTDWRINDNNMYVDENPVGMLYGVFVEDNDGGVISGNNIYFLGEGGTQNGIRLDNADDMRLEDNVIYVGEDYGIYVTNVCNRTHIHGGQIDGGGATGIYAINATDITVNDVVFKPSIGTAVDFNRASVVNPVVTGCYARGVTTDYSTVGATNRRQRDNIALGGGWAADI